MGSCAPLVQDERGDPLDGYGLENCKLIFGDELQRTVRWKGGFDLSAPAGRGRLKDHRSTPSPMRMDTSVFSPR